jgi:hypothetical protein
MHLCHPRRSDPDRLAYRVGQVFSHKRYYYTAVIVGWDTYCKQPQEWILQMVGTTRHVVHVVHGMSIPQS